MHPTISFAILIYFLVKLQSVMDHYGGFIDEFDVYWEDWKFEAHMSCKYFVFS